MPKLIGLGDLFKNTWVIYREKFVFIVVLMIVPFLLMAVNQILSITGNGLVLSLAAIIGLVAGIGVLWAGAGLFIYLRNRAQVITVKEAYRLGWGKLLALIWVAILTMFIIGGGFMLFVIPGIILTIWLLFAQMLVIVEDEKGLKAIVKSREYVKGYFWPVLGRYVVIVIVLMIAYLIFTAIAAMIAGLFGGLGSTTASVLMSLLGVIINVLIVPFAAICMFLIYESLKRAKGSVMVDPAKKQGVWYLVIGLIGWVFIVVIGLFFTATIVSLLMGLFVGQALSGLAIPSTAPGTLPTPTSLPAGLTAEQQQQLKTQMEALAKLQGQLKQMKGTLPANIPAE
ncbi:MAG: hypothetical protein WC385_00535 [Candidatus Paceibacterota bacterium]|jgi:hypothetical protein